jgi:hypothetical protein
MFHLQETLFNSLKKQEVRMRDKHAEGCKQSVSVHTKVAGAEQEAITRNPRRSA